MVRTIISHPLLLTNIITVSLINSRGIVVAQSQSQSGSNKYACVCRLRTKVLLLGDACIHKKVVGACDQYLVPSRNLDDNKDLWASNTGLQLSGTLHRWLFRLLIVAGQVLTARFRPYLQVHRSLVTLVTPSHKGGTIVAQF